MDNQIHNTIVSFIWGIADDCLRDVYVRGKYREMMFPKKNVRFIAVNNGVDSANPADNDFTPFLNIMNATLS